METASNNEPLAPDDLPTRHPSFSANMVVAVPSSPSSESEGLAPTELDSDEESLV